MKKPVSYVAAALAVCAFAICGCGTTETAQPSQGVSVGQALQKSSEIRQQVQDAKTATNTAQTVNTKSAGDTLKDAAKEAVKPVTDEYNAWKDAVK